MLHLTPEQTKTRLSLIKLDKPNLERGERYQLIHHGELAEMVVQKIKDAELKIAAERWFINGSGQLLFGSIDVFPESMQGNTLINPHDANYNAYYSLGVRNSYNGKYALGFISGINIETSPKNYLGLTTSENTVKKKHVNTLDLGTAIEDAVNKFITDSDQAQLRLNNMRSCVIAEYQAYHLILKAAKIDLIPFRNCEYILSEWHYKDGNIRTPNVWWLMECFCKVSKRLGVADQFEFFKGIYTLLKEELGLEIGLAA